MTEPLLPEMVFTEADAKWTKKFNPMLAELVIEYAKQGKTEEEISDIIGINRSTLQKWRKRYPTLATTLHEAKKFVNDKVKVSLYDRCIGYDYEEERVFYDPDLKEIIKTRIARHAPPDPSAAITWLRFRDPDNWNQPKEDLSGEASYVQPVDVNSTEYIEKAIQALQERKDQIIKKMATIESDK